MHCGMFDECDDAPIHGTDLHDRDSVVVHVYSREDAITDGVLIPYRFTYQRKTHDACFSRGLYEKYKEYPSALKWIAEKAMKLLAHPDPEDTESRKLRVILDDQIWAILNGDGLTFLRPADY